MVLVSAYTVGDMLKGLYLKLGEDEFNLLYIAICGHMDEHGQRRFMTDLINRGLLATSKDAAVKPWF